MQEFVGVLCLTEAAVGESEVELTTEGCVTLQEKCGLASLDLVNLPEGSHRSVLKTIEGRKKRGRLFTPPIRT